MCEYTCLPEGATCTSQVIDLEDEELEEERWASERFPFPPRPSRPLRALHARPVQL